MPLFYTDDARQGLQSQLFTWGSWLSIVLALALVGSSYGVGHPNLAEDLATPLNSNARIMELFYLDPDKTQVPGLSLQFIDSPFGPLIAESATGSRVTSRSSRLADNVVLTAGHNNPAVVLSPAIFVRRANGQYSPALFFRHPETPVDLGLLITIDSLGSGVGLSVSTQLPMVGERAQLVGYGNASRTGQRLRPRSQRRVGTISVVGRNPSNSRAFEWAPAPYSGEPGDSGGPIFSEGNGQLIGVYSEGPDKILDPLNLPAHPSFIPVAEHVDWIRGSDILVSGSVIVQPFVCK